MSGLAKEKVFKLAKGFLGRGKNCIRIARNRVDKGLQHNYRDRKRNTRQMRSLWITRVNAGARELGIRYSDLIHGMVLANVHLNRKMLAELAVNEPLSFQSVVEQVKHIADIKDHPAVLSRFSSVGLIASSVVTRTLPPPTPKTKVIKRRLERDLQKQADEQNALATL